MLKKFKKASKRLGLPKAVSKMGGWVRRIVPFALLFGLAGTGIFWVHQALYAAKVLELEKVRVIGLETLSPTEVLKMADLKKGLNLLKLDLERSLRAMESDPRIRSVRFRKLYPNRLEIRIEERRPVLQIWNEVDKRYYLIDEEGVFLPEPTEKPAPEFIRFVDTTVKLKSVKPGEIYPSKNLSKLIDLIEKLDSDPLIEDEKIREVRVDELGFWTFVTEDGIEFRVGESFDNLEKLENFRIMLGSEVRQTLDYLDLRFNDVVVKIKKGTEKKK